jgi:tetratricopeptide (TPR) repeat protein
MRIVRPKKMLRQHSTCRRDIITMHILQASATKMLVRKLHVHSVPCLVIMCCLCCCCWLQGRFEAAIRDYTQAIQLNPGHCRAYYNRAFSHDRLGQFEEAVADYSRALQIEPANATALHNRGSLFERMGR